MAVSLQLWTKLNIFAITMLSPRPSDRLYLRRDTSLPASAANHCRPVA
jgi:hypothetical protein